MNNTTPSYYALIGLHGLAILTALTSGHHSLAIIFLIIALTTIPITYTAHKPTNAETELPQKDA